MVTVDTWDMNSNSWRTLSYCIATNTISLIFRQSREIQQSCQCSIWTVRLKDAKSWKLKKCCRHVQMFTFQILQTDNSTWICWHTPAKYGSRDCTCASCLTQETKMCTWQTIHLLGCHICMYIKGHKYGNILLQRTKHVEHNSSIHGLKIITTYTGVHDQFSSTFTSMSIMKYITFYKASLNHNLP